MKNIIIKMPKDVEKIINVLNTEGFEAYAVGGCVRDKILSREPEDWDITTSALPEQVKGLFKRTVDTGILHGTVTVLLSGKGYEVTTYRIDGEYEDSRRPKSVEFVSNLTEDLRRRDFTINAMAYNPKDGIIDKFGGVSDIENKIIRCVGDPKERFTEDALRILRAVRFSAQLSFEIEEMTKQAISYMSENLKNISKERIQVELDKLLMSDNPQKIRAAFEMGITKYIFPEFDLMMAVTQNTVYHDYSVGEHTIKVLENTKKDHYLRWAALLHDIGKPVKKTTDENGKDHFYGHADAGYKIAKHILKELRFDNKTVDYVSRLVKYHDCKIGNSQGAVRKSIKTIGEDIYPYFLMLRKADIQGKSSYGKEGSYEKYNYVYETYIKILENGDCLSLKDLNINGEDLIEIGIKPGKEFGEILNKLLDEVLETPELNKKELLIEMVKKSTSV